MAVDYPGSLQPLLLVPSLALTLVSVYFLFRPVATQYFTGNGAHDNL